MALRIEALNWSPSSKHQRPPRCPPRLLSLPFRTTHAAAPIPFPSPPHTAVIQPLCHPRGSAVPPVSLWSNNGSFQWRFLPESTFPQTFPLFHSPSLEISKIPLLSPFLSTVSIPTWISSSIPFGIVRPQAQRVTAYQICRSFLQKAKIPPAKSRMAPTSKTAAPKIAPLSPAAIPFASKRVKNVQYLIFSAFSPVFANI